MSLLQEIETYGLADCEFNRQLKTAYLVYSQNNTLISAHDNAAAALKHALIYQHATGKPAHVEQVPDVAHQVADDLANWHDQGGGLCS